MTCNVHINKKHFNESFLDNVYKGDLYIQTELKSSASLCKYAQLCIEEIFDGIDIFKGFNGIDVKHFISLVERLKNKFTNSQIAHQAIRSFIVEMGQDPSEFIFHAPRIRVIPDYEYLHAGMSYAYKAHRDTWYGGVDSQINVWMPVFDIVPEQAMWINPSYFNKPVMNSSNNWSVKTWMDTERWKAKENEKEELRVHPVPLEAVDESSSISFAGQRADTLVFSGAHLHGSNKNTSGSIRYSTDFRIIKLEHLRKSLGAVNVDNGCKDVNESAKDFYYADTLKEFEGI